MKSTLLPKNSPPEEGWQAEPDGVVEYRATKNYTSLPYNPSLKDRAKTLRKARSLAEVFLWGKIKSKKFYGIDFDRQKIKRELYLISLGLRVIRLFDSDVKKT
jgi:very-short-patch-repair endonuclease